MPDAITVTNGKAEIAYTGANRTEGSWFGSEARMRQHAWDSIMAVATR